MNLLVSNPKTAMNSRLPSSKPELSDSFNQGYINKPENHLKNITSNQNKNSLHHQKKKKKKSTKCRETKFFQKTEISRRHGNQPKRKISFLKDTTKKTSFSFHIIHRRIDYFRRRAIKT